MTTSHLKIAALAAGLLTSAASQAAFINGEINISGVGSVTLINNFGPGGTATTANADAIVFPGGFFNAFVTATAGDFNALPLGTLIKQNNFAFNPTLSPSPVAPLWSTVGGPTWSFQLDSITTVSQDSNFINLTGLGTFDDGPGGYLPSAGDWTFTVTSAKTLFTWTSSQAAPPRGVPDNGGGLALLGGALAAVGLIRRKLVA